MITSHRGLTGRGYAALVMTVVAIAASSMLPQPAFAKKFTQIGEDMGKCMQKFTGTQNFKDKMCACKDSACAQLTGNYDVVWTRPTTPSDDSAASTVHHAN